MENKPIDLELVAKAHEIIDGIPDKVIDLKRFVSQCGESPDCGTIACGAGWLALHPYFKELGLTIPQSKFGGVIRHTPTGLVNDDALRMTFGGEHSEVYDMLFSPRNCGTLDYEIRQKYGELLTDKAMLLHRLKYVYHGALQ